MTETTQSEGGAEQVNQELPTPKFTEASPVSATSSVDAEALALKVAKILRPDFEKVAQSTKDKRIAQIEKRLGLGDLAELEELGAQIPDNVKLEYRFRQLESERQKPDPQPTTSQGSGANLAAQEVSEVVKKFKLDANDPEVIEALRGTYRNRDHFEVSLAQMALARANRPTPSAANAATISSSPPAPSKDVEQLTAEYKTNMRAARGDKAKLSSLRDDYKKKGVDVYNIDFS
jgi:hypothetical protein